MKIRKKDIQFFLVGCGLLFIPSLLRVGMLKSQWALVNVLSWIGIILLTQRYYGGGQSSIIQRWKQWSCKSIIDNNANNPFSD